MNSRDPVVVFFEKSVIQSITLLRKWDLAVFGRCVRDGKNAGAMGWCMKRLGGRGGDRVVCGSTARAREDRWCMRRWHGRESDEELYEPMVRAQER